MAPIPKRISQLDAAGPLSGAEQFPLVQNERTKQVSLNSLRDFTDTSCQCTLVSRYNVVGNDTSAIKYFQTYTLPGNTVATDGSWLHIFASGQFAATGNFKYATVELNQTAPVVGAGYGSQSTIYNDYYWEIELRVQRNGADGFTSFRKVTVTPYNAGSQASNVSDTSLTYVTSSSYPDLWLNDIQINVLGKSSASAVDDVTCAQFIVVLHKLDTNS